MKLQLIDVYACVRIDSVFENTNDISQLKYLFEYNVLEEHEQPS